MKISRAQKINIPANGVKNEVLTENPITETKNLPSVSANTLRAYNNIPFKGKFIPKSKFVEWLKSTGFIRTDIIDDIFSAFCDETSQLSERAFEILKSFQEKGQPVITARGIFANAKENGKLNYRALGLIDNFMGTQRECWGSGTNFQQILTMLKDKNGNFNENLIEVFEQDIPTFKQYMSRCPEHIFNAVKDSEGNFSEEAIKYLREHNNGEEKIHNVLTNIYTGKNPDGTFDAENIEIMRTFDETFGNRRGAYSLQAMVRNVPKEQKQNIINIASTIKDDKQFEYIMRNMQTLNLEFNEANIGFARTLTNITKGREDVLKMLMEKIKLTPEMLTEENTKILSRVCEMFQPKELEKMLNASIYKAGDKKGQFSFENLNRYKEIYTSRYRKMDIVETLSSRFSLEEDDKALTVFHRLYTMEWPNGTYNPDKVDEHILNFMTSFGTMEKDNIPQRPMPETLIENIEQLLLSKYATQSKAVFENFVDCPNLEAIEKFERVNLEELGLKPEQVTAMFQYTNEADLLTFKEFMRRYMQKHNLETVDIASNPNIKGRIEISSGTEENKNILLYDFTNQKPITNIQVSETRYNITKTQHDYGNNTETTIVFRKKDTGYYRDLEVLQSQTIKHFDDAGNEIYRDVMEQSPVRGALNIKKVYPDGREEIISNAYIKDGHEIIEKNMESLDGTRTIYRFETDNNGNTITDYTIINKDGKTLMNQSTTYETLSENHYRTSKNGVAYDIKIENNSFIVTNENTQKTITLNLSELTEGSEKNLIPLLKQFSGDELFKIYETGLKNISYKKYYTGASFSPDKKQISIGKDMEDLGIILHEFGHAKDRLLFSEIAEQINSDPKLLEIYNKEREAFRSNFSESQLDLIGYFTSDQHYTGGLFNAGNPLIEGIAETNTLLNTHPHNDVQAVRAQYWQQYFPETIASIAKLIN